MCGVMDETNCQGALQVILSTGLCHTSCGNTAESFYEIVDQEL
jgi:hypothetical protein